VYSNDRGRTFQEFEGNPVVKHKGRDPRLFWYAPGKHWVMAVYDEVEKEKCIAFYTSPDLKTWTFQSRIAGFYECPDIFELPLEEWHGHPAHESARTYGQDGRATRRWVLTAANSDYMVGQFDGKKFTPETPKLKGHLGKGFYAAQTFSGEPKGRVVQIGWLQVATPGMPFNQAMSLPLELKLRGTQLTWTPVEELKSLRDGKATSGELLEVRAELDADVTLSVRGATIRYDAAKQELNVNGHSAPAPLVDGKQRLIIYIDRNVLEVFASDGLTYVPLAFTPKPEDQSISITSGKAQALEVYKLKSCWSRE
jgi:fructan beta-fructosidase